MAAAAGAGGGGGGGGRVDTERDRSWAEYAAPAGQQWGRSGAVRTVPGWLERPRREQAVPCSSARPAGPRSDKYGISSICIYVCGDEWRNGRDLT